jgi:hybrid cluster-associated redox disulfide protein
MKKKARTVDAAPSALRFRRDMLVAEAVDLDPRVKDILLEFGLPCHLCIVAEHETLEEGCAPLGLEVEAVLARLNALR